MHLHTAAGMRAAALAGITWTACALGGAAGAETAGGKRPALVPATALTTPAPEAIPLTIRNPLPFERRGEPVTCGLPLARGFCRGADSLALIGPGGKAVPLQVLVTARYKDGSPRWVLLDFQADLPAGGRAVYRLVRRQAPGAVETPGTAGPVPAAGPAGAVGPAGTAGPAGAAGAAPAPPTPLEYRLAGGVALVDTGAASFRIDTRRFRLFDSVRVGGVELVKRAAGTTAGAVLTDRSGRRYGAGETSAAFEDAGPLRVVLALRGSIGPARKGLPLARYVCRIHFYAGKSEVRVFYTLHNPAAQNHPGNVWDLGGGRPARRNPLRPGPGETKNSKRWT